MTASPDALHGYHAHIYYNDDTHSIAEKLRDTLASDFPVQIGKNAGIAGPHPPLRYVGRGNWSIGGQ